MGMLNNYVRNRKAVKASRATEDGRGAFATMGDALGYSRVANHLGAPGGNTIDTYQGSAAHERGERFSATGQGHVTTIPAGSKPLTAKNSDWGTLPKY
jgi:hypothetical protein